MIELIEYPTKEHLSQIEPWLQKENLDPEAFSFSWDSLVDDYNDKQLYCFIIQNEVVGFICWRTNENVVILNIVDIKPEKRSLGLGKQMVEMFLNNFKEKGFVVADGQCANFSESFWEKQNFITYESGYLHGIQTMYKPLIEYLPLSKNCDESFLGVRVELWDKEPWEAKDEVANWCWLFVTKEETLKLELPIVFPANQNWRMRVTIDGEEVSDCKIKHRADVGVIHRSSFLYIEELPK